jgi:hypothetical protein
LRGARRDVLARQSDGDQGVCLAVEGIEDFGDGAWLGEPPVFFDDVHVFVFGENGIVAWELGFGAGVPTGLKEMRAGWEGLWTQGAEGGVFNWGNEDTVERSRSVECAS